jgi:riboflavin synthase
MANNILFSGVIDSMGIIEQIEENPALKVHRIWIKAPEIISSLQKKVNISVNGVCLTVQEITSATFRVDIWPETWRKTTLSTLVIGEKVNLEKAYTDHYDNMTFCCGLS